MKLDVRTSRLDDFYNTCSSYRESIFKCHDIWLSNFREDKEIW